jgi:hypothetical protein
MSKVFALCATAISLSFLLAAPRPGQTAEFTPILPLVPPTVVGSSEPHPGGVWLPGNLVDGKAQTEFAAAGQGVGTHVDFDFGKPVAVAGFKHIDRNDPATVRSARLVFSAQAGFRTPIASVSVDHADRRAGVTQVAFPAVTARYVRWEVTGLNKFGYGTVGGAEIAFFTTASRDALPVRDTLAIRPEQLVVPRNGRVLQPIAITVEHRYAEPVKASLEVEGLAPIALELRWGTLTRETALPALQADAPLRAVLKVEKQEAVRAEIVRRPVRPWTIYLLPHSHIDIGYTALQPDVERKQISNLKTAMRLAKETAGYPEGSRFKWNVEVMWPVDCFLRRAMPEEKQQLFEAVRAGQVGLDGLYGNMLTGLSRPEEQMRTMDCGLEVARQCGVPLESAMISDVPGYTWGTAVAMAHAGVKYFSFGPNYGGRVGHTMVTWPDKPFYWETPDGRSRVLCWCPRMGYALGHIVGGGRALAGYLPGYLGERAAENYPYDITYLRWNVNGDNGAPDEALAGVVKQWNEEHLYPKLIIATTATAFREFEKRYGRQLPVLRGDFTPYWEDGAASSALETSLNRDSAERLVQAETLWTLLCPKRPRWPEFAEAWRNVLLYSEHTWGAYDSVENPDRPFVRDQWRIKHSFAVDADRQSRELLAETVFSPGLTIATRETHVNTITVFNTNSWPRTDLVILPRELPLPGERVEDASGKPVLSQRLTTGEFVFLAGEVPPLAGKPFAIKEGSKPTETHLRTEGNTLTGADLTVRLDPATGGIASLRSRRLAVELVDAKAATAVNDYFYLAGSDLKHLRRNGLPRISVKESGPLVTSLVVDSEAPGCNRLSREIRLIEGLDRVDLINRVDKKAVRAKEGLHFGFGFAVPEAEVRLDVGWAVIRPNKDQLPGSCRNWFSVQRFVDVSNAKYGVTWAPADAPMVEIGAITGTLSGSGPNSADYLYMDPKYWMDRSLESPPIYSFAMNNHWGTNYCADQQGLVPFRYSIRPHGPYQPAESLRFGIECSQPLLASAASQPTAGQPRLMVSPADMIVTSLRPSRDGKALIVRLFNAGDRSQNATIRWAPPEPQAVWQSDLSERPLSAVTGPIDVPAWGVITLRAAVPEVIPM